MKSIKTIYTFNGKEVKFNYPSPTFDNLEKSSLTKKQKREIKESIKKAAKDMKNHFKDGAWDIDSSYLLDEILYKHFGFHISDMISYEVCKSAKVEHKFEGIKNSVYTNRTKKVFYSNVKNNLYVATTARDVNNDVQLGDL